MKASRFDPSAITRRALKQQRCVLRKRTQLPIWRTATLGSTTTEPTWLCLEESSAFVFSAIPKRVLPLANMIPTGERLLLTSIRSTKGTGGKRRLLCGFRQAKTECGTKRRSLRLVRVATSFSTADSIQRALKLALYRWAQLPSPRIPEDQGMHQSMFRRMEVIPGLYMRLCRATR